MVTESFLVNLRLSVEIDGFEIVLRTAQRLPMPPLQSRQRWIWVLQKLLRSCPGTFAVAKRVQLTIPASAVSVIRTCVRCKTQALRRHRRPVPPANTAAVVVSNLFPSGCPWQLGIANEVATLTALVVGS